ncbi:GL10941 [Drosophila persimilis]|uniref:GL10941 n=1 Tax=Drosophila persimilis TaxID=7234 RepID=B4GCN7_DROPE|nr:GL10941 [Drosophila persimilis]
MDMPNERLKWLMLYAAVALIACGSQTLAANPPDADQKGPVFLKEPTNRIDFSNSTGAEIECKASGNPMPEIIWIRSDGTAVGDVPGLRQISSDGKLVFPPFRAEDYRQEVHAQVYACLARNQFGSIISRDVHVRAVVAQYYEADVNKEHVIRGNAAVIKCLIPSFVADFVEVVSWHADEEESYFPGTEYVVSQHYEEDIHKAFVIRGNSAILKCDIPSFVADFVNVISWHSDQQENFYPDTEYVVSQFYITEAENEYVIRGNAAVVKCKIPSFVADFVQVEAWVDDGGIELWRDNATSVYDGKYLVLPSGELHIREVGPEDGYKSYQCRTKHRLTGETRLSATKGRLVITEPISSSPPKINALTYKPNVVESTKPTAILCPAQGYPAPSFRWYKFIEGTTRKQAVVLNDRVKQVSGTLIIKDAVVEDSGKYLCVVNNSVGGESVETVLTVTAPLSAKIDPPTQTVDFGRPAVFTCQYTGNPIKTVSWMKDGKAMGHSEPVLRIESVKKEDKGMYQCFVRNDQESAEASAELKLGGRFDPPVIRQAFQEETMEPGPSVFLKCVAGGNPTPEISWELDGKKIANNDRYQVGQYVTVNGDVVSYLNITSVHANDGGLYKCIAKSKVGEAEHSAKLNVYGLPYIRQMEKKAIVAGETLIVTCPVAGYPIDSIVWERDNRALPINRKQKVFPNGTLIIENVERNSDQATYTCVAKNQEGYSARGSLEVQVMVPPQIVPFDFGEETINMNDMVSATCTVNKGDTPLELHWTTAPDPTTGVGRLMSNDGILITKTTQRISMLSIESVHARHRANYTCVARNAAGVIYHTAELRVNVPPQIQPFDFGVEPANTGEVAGIFCMVPKGDLPMEIRWTLNSAPIITGEHGFSLSRLNPRTSSLSIDALEARHRGLYKCIASNKAGIDEYSAELHVNVPPRWILEPTDKAFAQGSDAKVECKADGFPKPQVTWNSRAPTDVSSGDGTRISSRAHAQPRIITKFGEWETAEVSVDSQKHNIESLLCGSRYQVYATGFNNIGAGEASDILNTRTKGQKPKLPEKPRFIEVSSNSVSLHFKAWKDGGCPMSHFVVESKKRDQIEWNQISNNVKPDNNYVVLDLEPATWYNLRITAHNSAGFTVAEYDFATLTVTGGTIAPSRDLPELSAEDTIRIILSNLNLVVPVVAALLVIIIAIIVICILRSKGNHHKDDVVYNQTMGPGATLDKRRPDLRDELGYIAPPNRKLPPVPGSNYNTCDRIKRGHRGGLRSTLSTWDPRRPNLYEELKAPPVALHGNQYGHGHGNAECHYRHPGMEDEICPYATFHLLGFREEMDPTKAMNFQTFPHQNGHTGPVPGHAGTMLPPGHPGHVHSRSGSQSMPRANRYQRKNSQGGQSSIYTPAPEYDDPANCAEEDQYRRYTRVNSQGGSLYSGPGPEYDDPANCAPEEDQYGSQYGGPYGQPYDHYGSRGSMGRRSVGSARNPGNGSPEPPPPPPRNHDMSNSSFNDSKESNEISEAECDRDHGPRGHYGAVKRSPQPKDQRTTEEMRKLIERNEAGPKQLQLQQQANGAGFTAYDTMAV